MNIFIKRWSFTKDNIFIYGGKALQFGQDFEREANAGQISYGRHDGGVNGSLNIIGAGKNGQARVVRVWDTLQLGDTYLRQDDDWVRLIGNKNDINAYNRGLAAKQLWARDNIYTPKLRLEHGMGPYKVRFFDKGTCLDAGQFGGNGDLACNDVNNAWQQWYYNPTTGHLRNVQTNKCLDTMGGAWQLNDCNNHQNQRFWRMEHLLRNGNGQCLDVGNKDHKWNCDGNNNNQKLVLKEFINSVDSTPKLREFYNTKINEIKDHLIKLNKKVTDKAIQIKINEVMNIMPNLSKTDKVDNDHLVNLLQYYQLVEELEAVSK